MTLLIVDDDPPSLKLLRAQLEAEGHIVFEAHDGVDALALLERQRVDAVISDILMPRMDGYRLCHEIRQHARLHDLPIILNTATYTSPDDEKLALDVGADKYLKKPVSLETLVAALHEVSAMPHAAPQTKALQEVEVLKEYSERLVFKLEEKNTELMAAEVKFRALVEQSIVGIYIVQDDRFVYVNPGMQKIFGWSEEEMTSRTLSDFVVPKDQVLMRENFRRRISGEVPSNRYSLRVLHQSGAVLQVEVHSSRTDYNGRLAVMGMLVDITERKRAEEAAQRSQKRLRDLIDGLGPSMFVGLMTPQGILIEANRPALAAAGLKPEDVLGKPFEETYWWTYSQEVQQQLRETIARAARGEASRYDVQVRAAENHLIDIDFSLQPLRNETGEVVFLVPSANVITERKQTENALRASERKFQSVFEQAAVGVIIVKGSRGHFANVNRRFCEMVGYSAEELLQLTSHDITHPDDIAAYTDQLEQISCGIIREFSLEKRYRRKDGSFVWAKTFIAPLDPTEAKPTLRIGVIIDITERRRLEDQLRQTQKMEAIGQLASGVAHDFNNILAAIQLQAGLLKAEQSLSPEQLDFAGEIEKSAQRAADLTRQLLLFSRKQALQLRDLNLNEAVTSITKMLQRVLGEDVEMQFKFSPQPLLIHADAGMMDQILMNLTVNARDAMPKGGQLIIETSAVKFDEVTAAQTSPARPGSFACVSVSDTGCGIPPEILPRIFEPFFTTKEVGKGTGLGLATAFGIVQQHQGWINVHSEAGQGTTFRIYLPRLTQRAAEKAVWSSLATIRGGNETILLVEDEPALRAPIRIALSRLGYRVLEASNGPEALEVWKQHRAEIRLLLTDLVLPGGISGKELGEQLLQSDSKLKVVYVSGYSADIAGKDFHLEEGVNFLTKPFAAHKLAETVRNCLDKI
jgi:PAS domain S-box-containing protein